MYITSLIHKEHFELLQLILTIHFHLHHYIHTLLLGDKKLRNKPKVISVFIEAHGCPLVAGDLAMQC